jgi:hypothetical protein
MAEKPNILSLEELRKLKGVVDGPLLVHLDKRQWNNLTRGVAPTAGPLPSDSDSLTLTFVPLASGGLVELRCPDSGPITGAEGQLRCGKPPVNVPDPASDPSGPEITFEFCAITFNASGSISCRGKCRDRGKKCTLRHVATPTNISGLSVVSAVCSCG